MNEFFVFDTKSNDQELTERFHRFFKINGLDPLFTREHQSSHITVSDLEMRSLVNTGKTAQPLLEIRDLLTMNTDNKRYDSAVLRLIDEPSSFTKFINNLKRLNTYYSIMEPNYKKNLWNIVYYDGTNDNPSNVFS